MVNIDKRNSMDIVVVGTGYFTLECCRAILDSGARLTALISMPVDQLPLNSADIKGFAQTHGVSYYEFGDLNSRAAVDVLRHLAPDYILSSWPKILRPEVLKVPRQYVIGSHPTQLPFNRGRHPLHWLIAQGSGQTFLSFFRMDEGVDTGDILLQLPVQIKPRDTINGLANKVNKNAYLGMKKLLKILKKNPPYKGKAQNHSLANYWRKRTPYDVTLDFRMSAQQIARTVRSFSKPYPCANLIYENKVFKILSVQIIRRALPLKEMQRFEPGKIISIKGDRLTVKAADQLVELQMSGLVPSSLKEARYIHPPLKYFNDHFSELSAQLNTVFSQ